MKYGDADEAAKKDSTPSSAEGATMPARVQAAQNRTQLR